ncbi:MAG TPA: KEOPS complex subunit Cgi121 [Candidatus Thermoplasmatota archaeon]|nr:KEOPS complex subunit Cgi121 [Candidatus Thermoplasmatota archaeon]
MMDFPEEQVAFAGLAGPLRLEDVLFAARKSNRIAPLQVVRADRVVGADHVRSAAAHAQRAFRESRAQAETLEVEFLRYLAGERQIKRALDKMGLPEGAEGGLVVALGPKRVDAVRHFVHSLGLREDDGLVAATQERLRAFGITPAQLAATTPARRLDLALEAVAAVDLMK